MRGLGSQFEALMGVDILNHVLSFGGAIAERIG
jgi:hypothetical protein